jgi:hypothetical protein
MIENILKQNPNIGPDDSVVRVFLADLNKEIGIFASFLLFNSQVSGGGHSTTIRDHVVAMKEADILIDSKGTKENKLKLDSLAPLIYAILNWAKELVSISFPLKHFIE